MKEKKTKTLQVRLTETEYKYLSQSAFSLGTDPSKLVRQLVQMSINAAIQAEKQRKEMEMNHANN